MSRLAHSLCLSLASAMLLAGSAGAASVTYLQTDTSTLGNWKGVYGQDGNVIAQHSVVVPAYSSFDTAGNINLYLLDIWATDPRALLKQYYSYSPTERIESWFHTPDSMDFLIGGADGQTHRIALYFADYQNLGRSVTVQAIDSATRAILDTRSLANYQAGLYLVYNYSGNITFRIINNNSGQYNPTGSLNAFFWGGGSAPPPPSDTTPPTVSITSPAAGSTVAGIVTVTASASDNVGVASMQFVVDAGYPGSYNLGTPITSPPYTVQWNTTNDPNSGHTVSAIARDAAANSTTATISVTVNNPTDTTPPTVSITSPAAASTVSGSVNVTVNASDNIGVVYVWYFLDGSALGKETYPYTLPWDTTHASNGAHTLKATAYDAAGNTTSASISVTVNNSAPTGGNTVSFLGTDTTTLGNWKGVYGQDGNVMAQHSTLVPSYGTLDSAGDINLYLLDLWATDPRALLKQFYSYSSTERIESYWHTVTSMDFLITSNDTNPHRIALYFCDYQRLGRSNTVQVIDPASNAVLDGRTLTDYTAGVYLVYTYKGNVTFRIINNNPGQYTPTAALSAFYWGGSGMPSGPAPDTTRPTVSITSPSANATVSGAVSVTASASDNVGVTNVQYQLDGSYLGSPITSSPYTLLWDTTKAANGPHTLLAIASDAAGNTGGSATVTVNVSNVATPPPDTTPPTVSITSPSSGATVSGNATLTASATDNIGVASVQFQIDNSNLGSAVTSSPYTISWDTTKAANGAHTIKAIASDAAGNTATASIAVNVSNAAPANGNAVTYIGMDTVTKGNWKGVYGQDGNFIAQHSYDAPSYSIFNPIEVNQLLVTDNTDDVRAPLKFLYSYSPTERIMSHWYNRFWMDFQITASDHQQHRIALYFADWVQLAIPASFYPMLRSITVQAINTDTGTVLDSRPLTDYTGGVYFVYNYSGNITFRIVNNWDGDRSHPNGSITAFYWGGSGMPQ